MSMLQGDERYVRLLGQYETRPKNQPSIVAVYVRKEDVVKAALEIAVEDLPALVRELHSPED